MKTERNKLVVESKESKDLFKKAFLFQVELENYANGWESVDEVQGVIRSIDQLMEALLNVD